jgi:hypothetical protein
MRKTILTMAAIALMLLNQSCEKKEDVTDKIDFEEIILNQSGVWNGSDNSGGFLSGNGFFPNYFNADWNDYWSGFACTNHFDVATAGYVNMYSSIAGAGADESEQYAVYYYSGTSDTILFTLPEKITRISVSNTTNSYLSMLNGDPFAKKFGGDSGNDSDWYKVILTGINQEGIAVGYVEVFLADFRFDNNQLDYISNTWTDIDLSAMGFLKALVVKIESSDTGEYGINTPAFVCFDNIEGILLTPVE